MSPQVARWCFTLNNYSPQELNHIIETAENNDEIKYLIIGKEVGDSGTPHLQGFCILSRSCRLRAVKGLISPRAHFEASRGSNKQASEYCKKEGDFTEFGSYAEPGTRTDFADFKAWVLQQPNKPTAALVASEFPVLFIKYGRIMEWVDLVYPVVLPCVNPELREWQQQLETTLEGEADDRKINFVIDPDGGKGKTWFVKYWLHKYPELTQVLSVGKRDDLAYSIDESKKFFFFDVPRSSSEFLQYSVFEKLKDRVIFSPKYGSRTKFLSFLPHVIIFMNEDPDLTKLSYDRYVITNV